MYEFVTDENIIRELSNIGTANSKFVGNKDDCS